MSEEKELRESDKPKLYTITETDHGHLFEADFANDTSYLENVSNYKAVWREQFPMAKTISRYFSELEDDATDPDRTLGYYSDGKYTSSKSAVQLLLKEVSTDHFVNDKINVVIMDTHKLLSSLIHLTELAKQYRIGEVHLVDEKYIVTDGETSFAPVFRQFLEYFRANDQSFSLLFHSNWITFAKQNRQRIDLSVYINPRNPVFESRDKNCVSPFRPKVLNVDYVYLITSFTVSRTDAVHLLSKQGNTIYKNGFCPDAITNAVYKWESPTYRSILSDISDHVEKFDKTTANSVCDAYFCDKLCKHLEYETIRVVKYVSLCDLVKMVSIDIVGILWICSLIYLKMVNYSPKWAKYALIIVLIFSVVVIKNKFWEFSLLSKLDVN